MAMVASGSEIGIRHSSNSRVSLRRGEMAFIDRGTVAAAAAVQTGSNNSNSSHLFIVVVVEEEGQETINSSSSMAGEKEGAIKSNDSFTNSVNSSSNVLRLVNFIKGGADLLGRLGLLMEDIRNRDIGGREAVVVFTTHEEDLPPEEVLGVVHLQT